MDGRQSVDAVVLIPWNGEGRGKVHLLGLLLGESDGDIVNFHVDPLDVGGGDVVVGVNGVVLPDQGVVIREAHCKLSLDIVKQKDEDATLDIR